MSEARLTEEQLEALRATHKKIGIVDWSGHQLVFRRPSRDECHTYRVALEHPEMKADAMERLCQMTILALDGVQDATAARVTFTGTLLVEHPMLASTTKVRAALGALSGLVEEEDAADLGKGVSVRGPTWKPSREGSPSGSPTSPAGPS
jgi:hypothetical protein